MLKRGVIFAAIVWFTLAAGEVLLETESHAFWGSGIQVAQQRDSGSRSRQPLKQSRQEQIFSDPLNALKNALGEYLEILVYGGIAGFGILMMGLAIGSASSSRNKTDAQLELLKQEKEKAENLAKLKSEFLNQVSHELRTPLAVIIGYIECITDGLYGEIEPKHQQILQVVANQSTHLKNMIDQILIYSRLEAGKHGLRVEDVNLTRVLGDLRETFEFLCRQKEIHLSWETQGENIFVRSDATRLKEVISNLLQNAVKYTDKGTVTVRTGRLSSSSIMVEVEDSGIGISETHLASIFEPFMQVHKTSTENSRGGIGLGLSIVKKHLEQIGGKISVKSELGKGSTFRIILPRNFERQKSRARWLFNWAKHAQYIIYPVLTAVRGARSQKTTTTGRAIG